MQMFACVRTTCFLQPESGPRTRGQKIKELVQLCWRHIKVLRAQARSAGLALASRPRSDSRSEEAAASVRHHSHLICTQLLGALSAVRIPWEQLLRPPLPKATQQLPLVLREGFPCSVPQRCWCHLPPGS